MIKTARVIIIISISFLLGYYFGVNKIAVDWQNYKPSISVVNRKPPANLSNIDFSLFWDVWQRLESRYFDKTKLDAQKMLNGAISGAVGSLEDPFTVYLPPPQNTNFKQGLAGQFSGIGAELGTKDKQIIVIAPLNESPAQKSGIRAGDTIMKVNGDSTSGWSIATAVEKIRGPKGTEVVLTILSKRSSKPKDIKVIRDIITVKSVDGWIKKVKDIEGVKSTKGIKGKETDEVIYIRLSQFGDSTNKDWLTLVNSLSLKMQRGNNVKGLILDLRNNPGGYLTDAVFIAGEFLKQGTTVVIEDSGGKGTKTRRFVSRRGLFYNVPVVVLINKGSASASEIVAEALAENKRAILIGETSFGKGTIQQAEELGNGGGIHITVAKWLTPNGVWINGKGIKPDINVVMDEKDPSHDLQLEKGVEELVR